MDEAARARVAAREALDDVTPPPLREHLDVHLRDAPMTPGVLTRLSANATGLDRDPDELDRRSAGVQLIYDGLALTRHLARTAPWPRRRGDRDPDIDILAADVLVARGFYLLARTEAARVAVDTVRSFGRDETDHAAGRTTGTDTALEADVFELAIVAGVTATGIDAPSGTRAFADDLATGVDGDLPGAADLLGGETLRDLAGLIADPGRAAGTPERIWAGSSLDQ